MPRGRERRSFCRSGKGSPVTAPALQGVVEGAAARVSGRLGCCVCPETGTPWAIHRAEETFATASVIKAPIAVAVAAEVEAGRLEWNQLLPPHLRDDAGDSGVIRHLSPLPYTVRDLVFLMLVVSDNRATNLLFARLPRTTPVAHKTGDMPGVENDAGVLYLPAGPIVAAVFTNELASDVEGRLAIQEIGRAIYDAGR